MVDVGEEWDGLLMYLFGSRAKQAGCGALTVRHSVPDPHVQ